MHNQFQTNIQLSAHNRVIETSNTQQSLDPETPLVIKAQVGRRSPSSFVSMPKGIKASEFDKSDKENGDNPKPLNRRKLIRTLRDVSSLISLIVSFLKIFQELGVL